LWYRADRWKARLLAEITLMEERFPQFVLHLTAAGELQWVGILEPIDESFFAVSLTYPARYPYVGPVFRVESPTLAGNSPHLYRDGSLCVHKTWDPERATAASCVPLICAWLVAFLHYQASGETF
jgi:ubiquitin-protein ligase